MNQTRIASESFAAKPVVYLSQPASIRSGASDAWQTQNDSCGRILRIDTACRLILLIM